VGSPPEWRDVPEEFQSDVKGLDALDDHSLQRLITTQMSESELERYDEFLELNSAGRLSVSEQKELRNLRKNAEYFMLKKAQAAVLLHWRNCKV
jgi:hypothetical protein